MKTRKSTRFKKSILRQAKRLTQRYTSAKNPDIKWVVSFFDFAEDHFLRMGYEDGVLLIREMYLQCFLNHSIVSIENQILFIIDLIGKHEHEKAEGALQMALYYLNALQTEFPDYCKLYHLESDLLHLQRILE